MEELERRITRLECRFKDIESRLAPVLDQLKRDYRKNPEYCIKCGTPLLFIEKHRRHSATRKWISQFTCPYCGWTKEEED